MTRPATAAEHTGVCPPFLTRTFVRENFNGNRIAMKYVQRLQTADAYQWDGDLAKLPDWLNDQGDWLLDVQFDEELRLKRITEDHGYSCNYEHVSLRPGEWAVLTESGHIKFMYDEEFRRKYEPSGE